MPALDDFYLPGGEWVRPVGDSRPGRPGFSRIRNVRIHDVERVITVVLLRRMRDECDQFPTWNAHIFSWRKRNFIGAEDYLRLLIMELPHMPDPFAP